jgi:predicted GNAT superfamily acetyltransferase
MLRGVGEVSWTFDPLVRRNAYFNIGKLATEPTEYLTNFYGRMNDDINGVDDTDRLLVSWTLSAPDVVAACVGQHRVADAAAARVAGAATALDTSPSGRPLLAEVDTTTVLVATPADVEGLRVSDPAGAADWRAAVRDVLGGLLADGARVRGFDRAGWYIVDRKDNQ